MRESPYGTLKESQAALVTGAGGLDGAAASCRVGRSTLARYADDSPENQARHMPVDVVAVLEAVAPDAPVTRFLAYSAGYLLLPMPDSQGEESLLNQDLARVGDRAGVLFRDYADFLANDGVIDRDEARTLLRDVDDFLAALLKMRSDVQARAEAPDEDLAADGIGDRLDA